MGGLFRNPLSDMFSFLLLLSQRTGIMEMREAMQEKVFISVCHLLKLWTKKFQCELNSSSINEQGIVLGKVVEQS